MKTEPEDPRSHELAAAKRKLAWALKSEDARRLNASLSVARAMLPITPKDLDADPMLLNCSNGTLELQTCTLRPHRREDMITKLCETPYCPDAPAPTWEAFLLKVFADDVDVVAFLQRFLGYCLTGDVREQQVPIFWGGGSNGKSTLLNAVLGTIGNDYFMSAPPSLLIVTNGDRHPTERADLFGKRLCVSSETGEGRTLNEEVLKLLTGGDEITGRRMREDFWRFRPTHKLILQTNHKPAIQGDDHGIWRRLQLVPFTVKFWDSSKPDEVALGLSADLKKDTTMPKRLEEERPGILAWLVRGCMEWQRIGLCPPKSVTAATQEYRSGEDDLSCWMQECCILSSQMGNKMKAGAAYVSFQKWQRDGGAVMTWNMKKFGERMKVRFPLVKPHTEPPADGQYKREVSGAMWFFGISLKPEREPEAEESEAMPDEQTTPEAGARDDDYTPFR